jgi:hypothetical protein
MNAATVINTQPVVLNWYDNATDDDLYKYYLEIWSEVKIRNEKAFMNEEYSFTPTKVSCTYALAIYDASVGNFIADNGISYSYPCQLRSKSSFLNELNRLLGE